MSRPVNWPLLALLLNGTVLGFTIVFWIAAHANPGTALLWIGLVSVLGRPAWRRLVALQQRIEGWFLCEPPERDPERLKAWNDPERWRQRRALKAANALVPSVSELAGSYDGEVVVHASCDGRPVVVIVGAPEPVYEIDTRGCTVVSGGPDNMVGGEQ